MKFSDSFRTSIANLRANKLRSILSMLGIVIGISSVIIMISIGAGAKGLILGQLVSFGSNNIFIEPGPWSKRMESGELFQSIIEELEIKTLTMADAEAIENLSTIEATAPMVTGVDRAIYGNVNKKITFMGITPQGITIPEIEVIQGRNITNEEVKSMARVAILGPQTAEDLFGEDEPLGKSIRIKKTNFRVIGVTEERGTEMFMNLDEIVFVPITTAQKILLGVNHVRWIIAKAESDDLINEAVEDIRLLLRERHNIYNPEHDLAKDDFKVMSQEETAEMLSTITNVLTAFLSIVASISLIVGGIGIMNIMLVSVSERTKEIGLRKAVGARNKDILEQFLIEAMALTIFGGIIGVIIGLTVSFLGSIVLTKFLNLTWDFSVSFFSIILTFGVASIIGLLFGIYPARKAARLDPITALRFE